MPGPFLNRLILKEGNDMPRKPASDKVLSRRVLVLINRDMTAKTSRIVWQHEIPILEAIFGDGEVKVQDPKVLDDGYSGKPSADMLIYNKKQDPILPPSQTAGLDFVFCGDARTEYDRLTAVYGRHPEVNQSMAEHVYGRFQDGRFQSIVGSAVLEDLPDAQLRELVSSWGADPEAVTAAKTTEQLLKLAEEANVELA